MTRALRDPHKCAIQFVRESKNTEREWPSTTADAETTAGSITIANTADAETTAGNITIVPTADAETVAAGLKAGDAPTTIADVDVDVNAAEDGLPWSQTPA